MSYYGGSNQETRMQKDKLRSLRKALLYSYQSVTIALPDEEGNFSEQSQKFRALINPDKNKSDYDDKILSIPYEDICLNDAAGGVKTSEGLTKIDIKPGSVFEWVETKTKWLVYLQFLEEDAYFRAEIRRCDQQTQVGDKKYWTYIRGPMETSIQWNQKGGIEWNDLNYSLVMYITKDEYTSDYFHRFNLVKVQEPDTDIQKTWQVVAVNPYYGDGIIQVYLDEYFENTIEEAGKEPEPEPPVIDPSSIYIQGPDTAAAYDEVVCTIVNAADGTWEAILKERVYSVKDLDTNTDKSNNDTWVPVQKTDELELARIDDYSIKIFLNISSGSIVVNYLGEDDGILASKTITVK